MIDREDTLPLTRQAALVGLSRGAIYYEPRPVPERDLLLMRRMDELHLEYPFAGTRMLRGCGMADDGYACAALLEWHPLMKCALPAVGKSEPEFTGLASCGMEHDDDIERAVRMSRWHCPRQE